MIIQGVVGEQTSSAGIIYHGGGPQVVIDKTTNMLRWFTTPVIGSNRQVMLFLILYMLRYLTEQCLEMNFSNEKIS